MTFILTEDEDQSTEYVYWSATPLQDFGKPTELSHWAYSILLAQLMATLVHYTYTVPLPGLVNWSAFLEQVLSTL